MGERPMLPRNTVVLLYCADSEGETPETSWSFLLLPSFIAIEKYLCCFMEKKCVSSSTTLGELFESCPRNGEDLAVFCLPIPPDF